MPSLSPNPNFNPSVGASSPYPASDADRDPSRDSGAFTLGAAMLSPSVDGGSGGSGQRNSRMAGMGGGQSQQQYQAQGQYQGQYQGQGQQQQQQSWGAAGLKGLGIENQQMPLLSSSPAPSSSAPPYSYSSHAASANSPRLGSPAAHYSNNGQKYGANGDGAEDEDDDEDDDDEDDDDDDDDMMGLPPAARARRMAAKEAKLLARSRKLQAQAQQQQQQQQQQQAQSQRFQAQQQQPAATSSRNSWSRAAAAVGERPPDSASQNPLSLKMLQLKSGSLPNSAPAPGFNAKSAPLRSPTGAAPGAAAGAFAGPGASGTSGNGSGNGATSPRATEAQLSYQQRMQQQQEQQLREVQQRQAAMLAAAKSQSQAQAQSSSNSLMPAARPEVTRRPSATEVLAQARQASSSNSPQQQQQQSTPAVPQPKAQSPGYVAPHLRDVLQQVQGATGASLNGGNAANPTATATATNGETIRFGAPGGGAGAEDASRVSRGFKLADGSSGDDWRKNAIPANAPTAAGAGAAAPKKRSGSPRRSALIDNLGLVSPAIPPPSSSPSAGPGSMPNPHGGPAARGQAPAMAPNPSASSGRSIEGAGPFSDAARAGPQQAPAFSFPAQQQQGQQQQGRRPADQLPMARKTSMRDASGNRAPAPAALTLNPPAARGPGGAAAPPPPVAPALPTPVPHVAGMPVPNPHQPQQQQYPQPAGVPMSMPSPHGQGGPPAYAPPVPMPQAQVNPARNVQRQTSKRRSLFRRSLAAMGMMGAANAPSAGYQAIGGPASGAGAPHGAPGAQNGQPTPTEVRAGVGAGPRPTARAQANPQDPRRRSAFRKSVAWLMGQNAPPRLAPGVGDSPSLYEEKREAEQRKQEYYLGVAGDGEEWDVNGNGATFWRRFSTAQHHAADKSDPVTKSSQRWLLKSAAGRKRMKIFVSLVGIAIIGAIIGIVLWRNKRTDKTGSLVTNPDVQGTGTIAAAAAQSTATPNQTDYLDSASSSTRTRTRTRTHTQARREMETLYYVQRDVLPAQMPHVKMIKQRALAAAAAAGPTPAPLQ